MISKGFCVILPAAFLFLSAPHAGAQVYRCEGESGTTYSDLPCGDTAEEIHLEGIALLSSEDAPEGGGEDTGSASTQAAARITGEQEDLNSFLEILRKQREYQVGEIDKHLDSLRAQTDSEAFLEQDEAAQQAVNDQIASLESNKASILAEYEALIAEAQSRLE